MTFNEIKKNVEPHFYAISIDRFFPKVLRFSLRKLAVLGAIFFFFASFNSFPFSLSFADGLSFLCIFVYFILAFLESFYRSMRYEGVYSRIKEKALEDSQSMDYILSELLYKMDDIDASRCLFETQSGLEILERAGIEELESREFVYSNRSPVIASSLSIENGLSLESFIESLYSKDKSLQSFLSARSVSKEDFVNASSLVNNLHEKKRRKSRFWSKENLGSIPSMGTSWAYGVASDLGKFGVAFERMVDLSMVDIENGYRSKELDLLEGVLERRAEANVIIIDDDESVARDIVARLLQRMKLGVSLPSIEHKNIIELDTTSLTASFKDVGSLQNELLRLLNQAVSAGNVILYIRDLPAFVSSAKNIGVNLPSIISPFLASSSLQIIAHSSNNDFHYFIETNPTLLERFERIIPENVEAGGSLSPVIEKALDLEKDYGLKFSFGSLKEIVSSADRYVSLGEMPAKALDLLVEVCPWLKERGIRIVKEKDITSFVSEKTGISVGPVGRDESERIAHLEEILHKRVVGQTLAVSSVASAIRRARSGMTASNRPTTSLLFLGPTGVGKTETTKALAESFFGSEEHILRLDMSEYSGPDALQKLIGSFGEGKTGLLASRVRDNPYGVLLLDEFEKASPDILDLFLQVLDEGVFTDALGKKVNCRNLVIIATSNAGSSHIWQAIASGKDLEKEQPIILDTIIKERIFRPELLNRFDGVILFHPLKDTELRMVAELELRKLKERLKEKEMELVLSDELIEFVVAKGKDPQFGARAINRVVKNTVEDFVARKILSGEVKPGGKIEVNIADL